MKAIRRILAKIKNADEDYSLISYNDKIALGISGGKDSMSLLYSLHLYNLYSKKNFKIYPMIIDLGFDNFNPTKIKEFAESLNLTLDVVTKKDVYRILKDNVNNNGMLPCSICSKMKKAIINEYAKSKGIKKVAFAHHVDDAIETLFMNMIYGGRIATFSPYMHLEREDIIFIRPFIYVKEHQIITLTQEENIPIIPSNCPADKFTSREEIKNILKEIYVKYPIAKTNFIHMLNDFHHLDLWFNLERRVTDNEDICLTPITSPNLAREEIKLIGQKKIIPDLNDKNLFQFLVYYKEKPIGIYAYHYDKNNKIILSYNPYLKRGYTKFLTNVEFYINQLINKLYSAYQIKKEAFFI